MLRLFALLCTLALMLAPLAPAQAQSGCAMAAGMHGAQGADHQMRGSGHSAQACKQLCAVVAILVPPAAVPTPVAIVRPVPLRVVRLFKDGSHTPVERPPKDLV